MTSTYVAIVGLLAFAALFASLGAWQLRRAETSRATLAQFASGAADDVLAALADASSTTPRVSAASRSAASIVAEPQFLLDNMLHDGVAGYHVLTALRVAGLRRARARQSRLGAGRRRSARAARPRRRARRADASRAGSSGCRAPACGSRRRRRRRRRPAAAIVLQYPTAAELEARLGEPVLDYQLLLDAERRDGYVREWRAPGVAPERHLSYAGQWLALAVGAVRRGRS